MSAPRARILYIDDDPGLCRLVQKDLERRGYVVEIATDGASGVARTAQGGIDIIALDHYMPNQDGLETLASIRNLAEPPPVIYVTAMQEGRVAVAALKAGAADYVAKDVQGEFLPLLQRAIDAALDAVMLRRAKEAAEAEMRVGAWVASHDLALQRAERAEAEQRRVERGRVFVEMWREAHGGG